jgi:nicotinamidase-related amidase
MEANKRSWLMVIDHQPGFSHPDSAWYTPAMAQTSVNIAALVPLYGDRVVFTRFVPPAKPEGSWQPYYEKWPFALAEGSEWLWDVDEPWRQHRSIATHTFSKWTAEAKAIFGRNDEIVMCGVSTDCCVLATAFAAVDDGAQVRLVADACAAKSPVIHENALSILRSRAPQLTVVTTAQERQRMLSAQASIGVK